MRIFFTAVTYVRSHGAWLRISVIKLVWDERKKTYKWNMQEHKFYTLKMIIPLQLATRLRMSGAKPLFPQCKFNTGHWKYSFLYSRPLLQTRNLLLEELSLLGCDAVNIGKQLIYVSKDSYASIFRVNQPESQISELRKCLLYTNICKSTQCEFTLQLLRHHSMIKHFRFLYTPHRTIHTHLTSNYICGHIYQYFITTTHNYIVFYHFNDS
jgi:hypothetical protein